MTARLLRVVAMLGVMGISVVGSPAVAGAGSEPLSATLYVLTENMKLVPKQRSLDTANRRIGTSALTGTAVLGTPLCPRQQFESGPCAVNVLGTDDLSLATGLGTLSGHFTTVIQGDNLVDGPEAVALRGTFNGHMDFSPAILRQIPYGTFVGKVRASGGPNTEFTGIFRLPFAGNIEVTVAGVTQTLRQLFCPLSPVTNPNAPLYGGFDLAYLDFDSNYIPNGQCLDIQPTELSLGAPLVRFDIDY
jgi:hypothetical protein